jgi:hypothetical protein
MRMQKKRRTFTLLSLRVWLGLSKAGSPKNKQIGDGHWEGEAEGRGWAGAVARTQFWGLCIYQCLAVLESWPGSRPGSRRETRLTWLIVRTGWRTDLRFSQWELVDMVDCENGMENRPPVLTWTRTSWKNQFSYFLFWRTGQVRSLIF